MRTPDPKQRWLTFIRNHAHVIVACDFFVVITATFRTLYLFVLMEVGSRRILHHHVTSHPTAEWTLQQFREALPGDHPYRFVIHDRDSIFSQELDRGVTALGVRRIANTGAGTKGKLRMRALGRDLAPRMSGLVDPAQRTPPEDDCHRVGNPLQPRPASLLIRSWLAGTQPGRRSDQRP